MNKLLLFFLFSFSVGLQAQNWLPFQYNDSIQHFVAKDSIIVNNAIEIKPIYSVTLKSLDTTLYPKTFSFRRGFSLSDLYSKSSLSNYNFQPIKGKIIGDSLKIYLDSSVFSSLDSNAYYLNFPHHYAVGDSFLLGRSNSSIIQAKTIGKDTFRLSSNLIDSIAIIELDVYNKIGVQVTTHPYHHQQIIISKSNGLIETIDFTTFDFAQQFYRIEIKDQIKTLDQYQLKAGDSIYFLGTEVNFPNPNGLGSYYFLHEYIVLNDSISQNNLTLNLRHRKYEIAGPPIKPYLINTYQNYNLSFSIPLDSVIYHSSGLPDPYSINHLSDGSSIHQLGICSRLGPFNLVNFKSNYYQFNFNPNPNLSADSIRFILGLNEKRSISSVGFGPLKELYEYISGTTPTWENLQLEYAKIGNSKYGNKPIITTSLEEVSKTSIETTIYPNPVRNSLFINSKVKVQDVKVYTSSGSLIQLPIDNNQLNVSHLKSGLYFLNIVNNSDNLLLKFVKQ